MAGDASFKGLEVTTVGGSYRLMPESFDALVMPPNRSRWKPSDETVIEEIAQSIAAHGQLEEAIFRKNAEGSTELVVGRNRFEALKLIKADPAKYNREEPIPFAFKLRRLTPREALIVNREENIRRKGLSPIDDASYARALERDLGMPQTEIAECMKVSPSRVTQLLSLWSLPDEVLDMVHGGAVKETFARNLLGLPPAKIRKAVERVKAGESPKVIKAEVTEERRASGKKVGRTLSEVRTFLKPIVEDGAWLAIALSEYLAGKLGDDAFEKALRDASEGEAQRPKRAAGGTA